MRQVFISLILATFMSGPCLAGEVSVEDFQVQTTKDLIDLCAAPNNDPLALQAIHFCYGYLVGAYHYYAASVAGPNGVSLVCPPEPQAVTFMTGIRSPRKQLTNKVINRVKWQNSAWG
jgi:hypothetical protein